MKYGLIGCGRISTNHIKAAMENHYEIMAVCDLDTNQARKLLEKHNLHKDKQIRQYSDYQQMILNTPLDVVSIATESGKHAEIALCCIEHGIHVIIEKPMALSIADANQLIQAAEEHHVMITVCHQNRFNQAVQELRKALDQGRFGTLSHASVNIRWNRNQDYYAQAPWRGTWNQDGGVLMNQCIHGIDLLRWMLGDEIAEVYGTIRQQCHPYLEAEDVGMAVIRFHNGAIATIEGTSNVYPQNLEETLYIFGENGTVKLGGKSTNNIDIWNFSDEGEQDFKNKELKEATTNVYGNGHSSLFADMCDAIQHNRTPYIDGYAGKRALELVLAIYKSQKTGKPVKLPLDEFSTLDMIGEFS